MHEIVALQVMHAAGGVRADAVWGAAVTRAPDGTVSIQTFNGPRGGTLIVREPKTRAELGDGCTNVYQMLVTQKRAKGYKIVDPEEEYYGVKPAIELIRNGEHGSIKGRVVGSKPDTTHDFNFGTSNSNGVELCRICGKRKDIEAHGYKQPPVPKANLAPEAPVQPARPALPVIEPIIRQRRKLNF